MTLEALIDACQATVTGCFDCLDACQDAPEPVEAALLEATDAFEGLEEVLNALDAVELELRAQRAEDPTSATARENVQRDRDALQRAVEVLAEASGTGLAAALSQVSQRGRAIYQSVVPLLVACVDRLQTTSSPTREHYACLVDALEPNPFESSRPAE